MRAYRTPRLTKIGLLRLKTQFSNLTLSDPPPSDPPSDFGCVPGHACITSGGDTPGNAYITSGTE